MEKSIESIWQKGFLENSAMVAPKINNLYKQKSIHTIDRFKKKFSINLNALVIFSFVLLAISFLVKLPVMGGLMFILFNVVVIVNKRLYKGLNKIDKNVSSYEYLKSFNAWMQNQIAVNTKMSRYIYPYIFIAMAAGFWFSGSFRETFTRLSGGYQPYMLYGVPVYWMLAGLGVLVLLAIFGGRIYKWDLHMVYGGLIKKLEELMRDMDELRAP